MRRSSFVPALDALALKDHWHRNLPLRFQTASRDQGGEAGFVNGLEQARPKLTMHRDRVADYGFGEYRSVSLGGFLPFPSVRGD